MPLILLTCLLFKVLSIYVCLLVIDNVNTFRESCNFSSTYCRVKTFLALEHQERRGIRFTISIKAKLESYLSLILATSLLLYPNSLTSLLSIGSAISKLE